MRELNQGLPTQAPRIGLVAARFNQFITRQLLEGAMDALTRHGAAGHACLAWVPGAFELPLAAEQMLTLGQVDGVVALGAVIRGGTPHFDYVAGECARGLMDVGLRHARPVIFGVLTTDTVEQALERAGAGDGNKGFDAAMACLEMIALREAFEPGAPGRE